MGRTVHPLKRIFLIYPLAVVFVCYGFCIGALQMIWTLARGRKRMEVVRAEEFDEEDAEVIERHGDKIIFRSRRPQEIREAQRRGLSQHNASLPLVVPITPWMKKA